MGRRRRAKLVRRDYQARLLDEAALIAAARRAIRGRLADMLADIDSPNANEVTEERALYCDCCNPAPDQRKWETIFKAANSASPLARAAAVEALAALPSSPRSIRWSPQRRTTAVGPCARRGALAGLPADALRLTPEQARAVKVATDEQFASLSVNPICGRRNTISATTT